MSVFYRTFAAKFIQNKKSMDKKSNVRVVGFPKANYTKKWLDSINDRERSEAALADGNAAIFEDLEEYQEEVLNSSFGREQLISNWWYFLND